jgi:HK97 gp10 family phage protein
MKLIFNNEGLAELERVLVNSLDAIAHDIEAEAKILAPVLTGDLKKSIKVKEGDNKWEKLIGSFKEDKIYYAIYQELGTVKMDPNPFLRPALDKVMNKTVHSN